MSEAARSRRDDDRYGTRTASTGRDDWSDPLAELARLVGQEDPFRGVFRPTPPPADIEAGRDASYPADRGHDPSYLRPAHEAVGENEGHADPYPQWSDDDRDARGYGHAYDDGIGHQHHGYAEEAYDERYDAAARHGHVDDAGIAEQHSAEDAAAAATLPDIWARGGDVATGTAPPVGDGMGFRTAEAGERSPARRPLAVLAAVLVLTAGGLAASFLAKGPGSPAAVSVTSRGAPVIMAATGPTKVKVEDPGATAPEDQDAALLNKNGDVSSGPVRITSSQEQPADLSLLPKTSDLADGAKPLPPAAPSPFPEPKKVKTFVVHPDGTMLSAEGAPADVAGRGPTNSDAPASALPSTPKTAVRGGVTPKAATSPAPSARPDQAASEAAPVQPASPGVRVASAAPNDASDAPAASASSYGLQLASSPVEADAQAAFAKLKKRYPALLGSLTASVHKAETGDKPVYRVRTGGMNQDAAKSLCSKLQSAGGSCFVVHN